MKQILPLSLLLSSLLFAQNNFSGNTISSNKSIVINQTSNINKSENLIFNFPGDTTNSKINNNESKEVDINVYTYFNEDTNETKISLTIKNLTNSQINVSDISFKINSNKIELSKITSLNAGSEFKSDMNFLLKKAATNTVEVNVKYN